MQVNSHNEWDPLQEVIIGIAENAKFPQNDYGFRVNIASNTNQLPNLKVDIPDIPAYLIEETKEDLEIFAGELEKLGIIVHRPNPMDTKKKIETPHWVADQFFNYCPRDVLLVVGDLIIETANGERSRYFETLSYRDILLKCLDNNCRWIAAPKPRLREMDYNLDPKASNTLKNIDPVFDAANVLRAGKDLFYLISTTGNEVGLKWLRSILGEAYRIHACRNLYSGVHIDSTICLLRPGLALVNPARVNKDNLPKPLQKWDIIYAPQMEDYSYSNLPSLSSVWVGMNLLMVNPNLAVVDLHQKELIKLLEKHKIEVLPLQLRHGRILGGGFHCVTLDTKRKGKKENYFD